MIISCSNDLKIIELDQPARKEALDLVWSVFMRYGASDYTEIGIQTFKSFLDNENLINNHKIYGAYVEDELAGVIATRNFGSHIALFFVDGKYHRQGIGKALFNTVLANCEGDTITVNSSPYAVEIYKRFGFVPDCEEQVSDGIRFTPMTYIKKR